MTAPPSHQECSRPVLGHYSDLSLGSVQLFLFCLPVDQHGTRGPPLWPWAAHALGVRPVELSARVGSAGRLRHVSCSRKHVVANAPGSFVERTLRFSTFQITVDINASFSQHDLEFARKARKQKFHCE